MGDTNLVLHHFFLSSHSPTPQELFKMIEERKADMSCEVALSYLEVYNEQIRDLLEPSDKMLAIREDAQQGEARGV